MLLLLLKLPALVKLLHGSKDGVEKLVLSFIADHPTFAKAHIEKRIKEIAKKEKHPDGHGSMRWVVASEFLALMPEVRIAQCLSLVVCHPSGLPFNGPSFIFLLSYPSLALSFCC